jgi:acyl-CoA dehydrogenase family protein 9
MDPGNPGRMGMFVVERAWEGVSVGADMPKMGLSVSSTASVRFSEVRVPKENLVGEPGDGFKIAMTILNYGRLGLGAASAGLLSASLRDMERRSRTRAQFGVPIRRFELIQEKLVRARVHGLAASAMTSFTASLLERSPRMNVALESSHCKLYGTTRCWDALYDAQQTAGGSGYLSTLPYEKRLRDFRVTTIFEGTTEIHSIYPPLALLRFFGKKMQETGAPGRLLLLRRIAGKIGLRRAEGRETNPTLRRALRAAAQCERLFRSLLAKGLLRYGGRVVWEEFFLRRMTNLSMALFALVAAVWRVKSGHPEGGYPEEELDALRYLAEEAREVCGRDGRPGPTPKESIIRRMMKET